jgi:hypothetical protein
VGVGARDRLRYHTFTKSYEVSYVRYFASDHNKLKLLIVYRSPKSPREISPASGTFPDGKDRNPNSFNIAILEQQLWVSSCFCKHSSYMSMSSSWQVSQWSGKSSIVHSLPDSAKIMYTPSIERAESKDIQQTYATNGAFIFIKCHTKSQSLSWTCASVHIPAGRSSLTPSSHVHIWGFFDGNICGIERIVIYQVTESSLCASRDIWACTRACSVTQGHKWMFLQCLNTLLGHM